MQAPELGGQHAAKETSWRTVLAEALLPRLLHAHPDTNIADLSEDLSADLSAVITLQATALAGAGMACLTTAQTRWVDSEGAQPLPQLLRLAMTALAPVD